MDSKLTRMKKIVGLILLSFLNINVFAQTEKHVQWKAEYKKVSDSEGLVTIKATIDEHWHLFSQRTKGSLPTVFKFQPDEHYELSGKVSESKPDKDYFDDIFQAQEIYFEKKAEFSQKIKILKPGAFNILLKISYQTCIDEKFGGVCINSKEKLTIPVDGGTASVPAVIDSSKNSADSSLTPVPVKDSVKSGTGSIIPETQTPEVIAKLEQGCGDVKEAEDKSFWGIFIAGFLGGLLALLTPCVFPMIPLTVSFFTKQSKNRITGLTNALIYALSIMVIYTSLGFAITKIAGPDALNQMSTSWFFNLLFFIVFIIFSLSFFGAFEITLPSSFVNKIDNASNRGGLIGIFFMAFTLSLVSFSCTGPIIGTLLVEAAQGGNDTGPLVGMFGFSLALAFPFAFFAAFPGFLASLPKSGGWLNSVKITLGFLELALAMKFISNVDLAYHWGFIMREIFIAIWIVIFGLMGLYMFGKIKFKGDSDGPVSIPRLIFGILALSFTVYLIPGLWGAPLRMISGFPPPDFYKEWKTDQSDCPMGIDCNHNDFDGGMKKAKQLSKPVMLDFTGWNCVNCRKMEENVWPEKEIYDLLSREYVLISLYCDDREELPENLRYTNELGDDIENVGDLWKDFQRKYYGKISQPWYVLVDPDGRLLAEPLGYTPDKAMYKAYLEEGICRFDKRYNR